MIPTVPTVGPDGRIAKRIDVSEDEYHADPCEVPSLSYSMAKVLLSKSPAHAWHTHPKLGKAKKKDSDRFDLGHLAHKLILGKGRDVVIIDADDWRTKAAKEARDAARAARKIPALRSNYDNALAAAEAWKSRLDRLGISLSGESEVQIAWQVLSKRGLLWARAMVDHVVVGERFATLYDFKSCDSAHPRACSANIVRHAYDVQAAAYTSAFETLMPQYAGRTNFVFLFGETEAPYMLTPGELDAMLREHGERGWVKAVDDFADNSLTDGEWRGYTDRIIRFEAPGWLLAEQEREYDDAA